MSTPIAVLSFKRPDLLEQVLTSLAAQRRTVKGSDICLFQDWSQTDTEKHEECVSIFRQIFPDGTVNAGTENLGVALNFDRAEKWAFESCNAEIAYFFEDDLVLSAHYLTMLDQMAALALRDDRVAYVAAFGDHHLSLEEQATRSTEIIGLGHKWGFALTKRQWLRQKPIVDQYLEIVRKRPYSQRDHEAIRSFFKTLGYGDEGTSQDGAKDVASYVLGTVKLNTAACFAKNIGIVGEHSNEKFYEQSGFADTKIYDGTPTITPPTDDFIQKLIANQSARRRLPLDTLGPLKNKIYGRDPYEGFTPVISEPDKHGWNGTHPALSRAVTNDKPKIIVDLGVWKGQSTITLAKAQQQVRPEGFVIAVDTFLGSPEHWTIDRPDIHAALMFNHGRPSFYDIFLSNIVLNEMQDRILPIPQTSENAALIMKKNGIVPDLVHVDAAHEYAPALRDIEVYWDLLAPGGLLMGDDFPWEGVARAVVHFSDRVGVPFSVDNPKWWMRKPK